MTTKGITGSELMKMEFGPPNFIVEGLVSEGFNILGGNKGHGKSFMSLDVAIAVNEGSLLWDTFPVSQGKVVFLALEDTMPRLQRRLAMRGGKIPGNIEFYTEWKRFENGGLDDLTDLVTGATPPKLIVLDTLGRVVPVSGGYDATTNTYGALAKFGHRHHLAILGNHHLVKRGSKDPFQDIHGSTGIAGAADTLLTLKRKRFNTDAIFAATGKDVPETELAMSFDRNRGTWSLVGAASDLCVSDERQVLRDIVADHGQPMSLDQIHDKLAKKGIVKEAGTVRVLLTRMVDAGEISREGRGRYIAEREKLRLLPMLPCSAETSGNNGNKCNDAEAPAEETPAAFSVGPSAPSTIITSTTTVSTPATLTKSDAVPVVATQMPRGNPAVALVNASQSPFATWAAGMRSRVLARALRNGEKLRWPKGANAIRALSIKGKTTQMKGDEQSLKGVEIFSAEFGKVPFDRKRRPEKIKFQAIASAPAATTKKGSGK